MHLSQVIKQKSYEEIVFHLRRHPITFLPVIFLFLILLTVPLIIYFLISNLYPTLLDGAILYPLAVLGASIYFLSIYLFFYGQFIDYYLDLWIVTNDRIVDMEQLGLFRRTTTEVDLFRIQDVTANIKGVFPTIFDYGDVVIKTASANLNIVFRNVSNPNKIREELIRLADEDRAYHYRQDKESLE
jgi:membrane protein YdbS with pleckstrin-like domain